MTATHDLPLVEASIADLRAALESGRTTSVELVAGYLRRIAYYDRHGIRLNAVPVLNPDVFADARASDDRRARGETLGPLDGIPYTAKDSYKVRGLTVASGSPAFEHLIASDDAFTIARLRAAGAVLVGLTNMPPMADGGMQRGVYGRAASPYNADFLTAAFASGSSNGSGTATAASFAAFGLGEETWSSGRAPASNNGLVAYTPSRGVISVRGNWPLVPTMDVVVPHTRTVTDLFEVLNVIVADDENSRGDFWRAQPWIPLPKPSDIRPADYLELRDDTGLAGVRFGIPRMYINKDADASKPIATRQSVVELWEKARRDLEARGAEVVEVDFPVVSNYEHDRPGAQSMVDRGIVPEGYAERELNDLSAFAWDDFLRANADPALPTLAHVDGSLIFPQPDGALPDPDAADIINTSGEVASELAGYVTLAQQGLPPLEKIPLLEEGLRGLEETRRVDFEEWLDANRLDGVVFPAVADVGPADADVNPASAELAWRNGTWVANGNVVPRHLGIPTVTVPMGLMADIGMPVGLTFAGKAYADSALLAWAYAFEQSGSRRIAPPRTPELPAAAAQAAEGALHASADPDASASPRADSTGPRLELEASVAQSDASESSDAAAAEGADKVTLSITGQSEPGAELQLFVNGETVAVEQDAGGTFTATVELPGDVHRHVHSQWREPYGSIVMAVARDAGGACSGVYTVVGGIA